MDYGRDPWLIFVMAIGVAVALTVLLLLNTQGSNILFLEYVDYHQMCVIMETGSQLNLAFVFCKPERSCI